MSDDPLNLSKQPILEPPPDLWAVIEARLDVRAEQAGHSSTESVDQPESAKTGWLPMALAAAVSLAAIGVVTILSQSADDLPITHPQQLTAINQDPIEAPSSSSAGLLIAQQTSALLERQLSTTSNQVVNAGQLRGLMLLEAELSLLDELLADQPNDTSLWQQRVSLLDLMNQGYSNNHWQTRLVNASF